MAFNSDDDAEKEAPARTSGRASRAGGSQTAASSSKSTQSSGSNSRRTKNARRSKQEGVASTGEQSSSHGASPPAGSLGSSDDASFEAASLKSRPGGRDGHSNEDLDAMDLENSFDEHKLPGSSAGDGKELLSTLYDATPGVLGKDSHHARDTALQPQDVLHFGVTPQTDNIKAMSPTREANLSKFARSRLAVDGPSDSSITDSGVHASAYDSTQAIADMISKQSGSKGNDDDVTPPAKRPARARSGSSASGGGGSSASGAPGGAPSTPMSAAAAAPGDAPPNMPSGNRSGMSADDKDAVSALLSMSPNRERSLLGASRGNSLSNTPQRKLSNASANGAAGFDQEALLFSASAANTAGAKRPVHVGASSFMLQSAGPSTGGSGWGNNAAWASRPEMSALELTDDAVAAAAAQAQDSAPHRLPNAVTANVSGSGSWLQIAMAQGRAATGDAGGPSFIPPHPPAAGRGKAPAAAGRNLHVAQVSSQPGKMVARLSRAPVGDTFSGTSRMEAASEAEAMAASALTQVASAVQPPPPSTASSAQPAAQEATGGDTGSTKRGVAGVGRIVSRYLGVSWIKASQRWRADSVIDGKLKYLGCFHLEEEAARAVDQARVGSWDKKRKLRLNFPLEYPQIDPKSKTCAVKKVAGGTARGGATTSGGPTEATTSEAVRSRYVGVAWDVKTKMWKVRLTSAFAGALFEELPPEEADDGTHPAHLFTGGFGLALPAGTPITSVDDVFTSRQNVTVLFEHEDDAALAVDQSKYEQWRAQVDAEGEGGGDEGESRMPKPRFNFAERFMTTGRGKKRARA